MATVFSLLVCRFVSQHAAGWNQLVSGQCLLEIECPRSLSFCSQPALGSSSSS